MNERESVRNVFFYRLYIIFNEPLFWGPIVILSLQKLAGMTLPEIYYMEAIIMCLCVVLGMPSGALADVIGKKRTIVIARTFLFASMVFFAIMENPLEAWIGNILWAIGFTLQQGSESSFIYETLKEHGREGEFKKIQGGAVGTRLILIAVCSLLVGVLADYDLRLPLLVGLPFGAIALVAALFWKEPRQTQAYSVQAQIRALRQGILFALRSAEVRWMVAFGALILSVSKVWFFMYNPYFEFVGVPIEQYGIIFFLLNAVAWLSSRYAYRIEQFLGERGSIVLAVLCVGVPIIVMALVPLPIVAYAVVVQNIVRGFMRPFLEDYLHHHVSAAEQGDVRVTIMSTQTTFANASAIVGLAAFGVLIGYTTLLVSLALLGTLCLVLGSMSYRSYLQRNG